MFNIVPREAYPSSAPWQQESDGYPTGLRRTCKISFYLATTLTPMQVYLNIVLDDALEEKPGGEKVRIGMVVIRGNAVVMLEVRNFSPGFTKTHSNTTMLIFYYRHWTE
jgi:hypothetical protein